MLNRKPAPDQTKRPDMNLGLLEKLTFTTPLWGALERLALPVILNRLHPLPPGMRVLEVGCGAGYNAVTLLRLGAAHVTATDADPVLLARAAKRLARHAQPHQYTAQVADAAQLPFPAAGFDAVLDAGVLHHVEDWRRAVEQIARVLKPGGLFYGIEFYRPLLENPVFQRLAPHPPHRFTHAELVSELRAHGFTLLKERSFPRSSANPPAGLVAARATATQLELAYD